MHIALLEIPIGLVALSLIAAFVWSMYVILTTPKETWVTAGSSQLMWLALVVVMPLLGSLLFAVVGYRQLRLHSATSAPEATA